MQLRLAFGAFVTFFVFAPVDASGQAAVPQTAFPIWEAAAYVGVAHDSLAGTYLGVIPDRDHLFAGMHLTANFVRRDKWAVGWAPELALVAVSGNPRFETIDPETWRISYPEEGTGWVPGFALSPIGVEGQFRIGRLWRLYAAGAAGCVWFTRDVPVPRARAFNYTIEWGGGAIWQFAEKNSLRLGYKFHHLSNAYTAWQNPGLDGAVFLVGWQRRLGNP